MKNVWGWVSLFGLVGCGGVVDLGQTREAGTNMPSKLVSFAAVPPSGMCALFDNHQTYCWGKLGSTVARRAPELDAVALAGPGSQGEICATDEDGVVSCSTAIDEPRTPKSGVLPASALSAGFFGGCALGTNGDVQCWNDGSGICDSRLDGAWSAVLPGRAVQVDSKDGHACAVTEDGALYCFGTNISGEAGQDPDTSIEICPPMAVAGFDDVTQVALGMDYTCALRRSGVVSCFGVPSQLGAGNSKTLVGPIDVHGLQDVVAIKASRIGTCVLERSGTLKCWGTSECGSLGIAEACDSTQLYQPVVVHGELEIEDFGLDDGLTCVLTRKGDIQCWGFAGWTGKALGDPSPRRITFE